MHYFSSRLLQELTSWTATEEEEKEDGPLDVSTMTLLEVEQQLQGRATGHGQKLVLLQVLAGMVESLQHAVLLRKITQVRGKEVRGTDKVSINLFSFIFSVCVLVHGYLLMKPDLIFSKLRSTPQLQEELAWGY